MLEPPKLPPRHAPAALCLEQAAILKKQERHAAVHVMSTHYPYFGHVFA